MTIGVEYRLLDERTILEFYGPDARAKFDNVAPAGMGAVVAEDGLCLHVFGTDDGLEYLRFDCFDDAPHYHYLDPETPLNVVVEYDSVADGPMLDWAVDALRTRLQPMLAATGARDLADGVEPREVEGVLAAVVDCAQRLRAEASR